MRDPARINRILGKLILYWNDHPDLRLTQLLWNIALASPYMFFYVEDDEIEKGLDRLIERGRLE